LPELATFLEYVGAELHDSTNDYDDDFVGRLQNAVTKIKKSRRMEDRLEQLRKWVKLAARVESIDQFIKEM